MERKYSLAHLTVLGCPPPEMIYIAHLCGYDYVGIRPIFMGLPGEPNYSLSSNQYLFDLTKQALRETGIIIHDIELAKIHDGMDVSKYEAEFEKARELGVDNVISSIWTKDSKYGIERFREVCDLAAKYDMTVNLEFVTWAEAANLADVLHVLDQSGSTNAKLLIDTLHFDRSRVNLSELDVIEPKRFGFIHLCDGPKEIPTSKEDLIFTGRDARYYIGEGGIDMAAILRHLPQDLVISLELPHLQKVKDYGYAEHARRCLQSAKDYVQAHGL